MNIEQTKNHFPIGTKVYFYPIKGTSVAEKTEVRSAPWELGHGEVVVKVKGKAGGVSVDHLEAIYQPSNGTEGEVFISQWCESCAFYKDNDDKYCDILGLTFAFNTKNSNYPTEWIYDENGKPCCTKYLHDSKKPVPRCTRTREMF